MKRASLLLLLLAGSVSAEMVHQKMRMKMVPGGMVVNENRDQLPPGCSSISKDIRITVRAGRKYAKPFPGVVWTYDKRSFDFPACARVTVRFINEDKIRHQFMVHGLPMGIYPMGMFTIEVSGPGEATGTFILPAEPTTLLLHCDIAQHTEHGMKGQIKVAGGRENLSAIPGLTPPANPDRYPVRWNVLAFLLLGGATAGGAGIVWLLRRLWRIMVS